MDVYRNSLRTVHIGRVSSFWNQSMWPMETDSHGSSSSPSCGVERSNWAGGWVDKPGLKNMQSQVGIIIHLLGMEQRWNKVKCILWYLMISCDILWYLMIMYLKPSTRAIKTSVFRSRISGIWHSRRESSDVSLECLLSLRTCQERKELSKLQLGLSENSVPLHPMVNDHCPY